VAFDRQPAFEAGSGADEGDEVGAVDGSLVVDARGADLDGPAEVVTFRGWWWPLRTTRRRPCSSRSSANSAM
jgi:hypothetical protein